MSHDTSVITKTLLIKGDIAHMVILFVCSSNICEIVGEIDHSVHELDIFKNLAILVTQPGKLSSKTIFHVVLTCGTNVYQGNTISFKKFSVEAVFQQI